jgi:CRP-like cAMP-binding protein
MNEPAAPPAANRLDGIPFMACLTREQRDDVARRCRWRRYGAHEQIVDRDSTDRDVYFVVSGEVQIVNFSLTGREVAFATLAPGAFFGELSALDGEPRSASAVATKDSLLVSLPAGLFTQLVIDHPEMTTLLLRRLTSIIRTNTERIMDLSTLGAVQRVYLELIRIAEACRPEQGAAEWQISPLPTQKAIASLASTTRETVARSVSQLIAGGILRRRVRELHIADFARLRRLAGALSPDLNDDAV